MLVLTFFSSVHCYYNQRRRKYDYFMHLPLIVSLILGDKMHVLKKAQYKLMCRNKELISYSFYVGLYK